ncbi:MAG: alpha/beta fold hydrolase [Bacteroidota bacterium]
MISRFLGSVLATALLATTAYAQPVPLEPYTLALADGATTEAEIGNVLVPENRTDPASREIAVRFVRLGSRAEAPGAPIIYLAGGPGGSATGVAQTRRWMLLDSLRSIADVILLDQRGTGLSSRLPSCTSSVELPPDEALSRERYVALYREGLTECLAFWEREGLDIRGYTTEESAADIEAVRVALGAEQVSLLGISYGTHLALATLRRYPERIDRMVLASVEGPDDTAKLPSRTDAYFARLQAAIDADSASAARYPDVRGLIAGVLAQVAADPPRVTVRTRSGETFERTLGPMDLQRATGGMISDPGRVATILDAYTKASDGDFTYFSYFPSRVVSFRPMPTAMDLASGVSPARAARIEVERETALLGDALNFPMPHLHGAIPHLGLPAGFREPVTSDRPTLIFSGTLDGRTYPEAAAEVAAGLSRSAIVTIENAGHNLFFSHPDVLGRIVAFFGGAEPEPHTLVAPAPTFASP